MLNPEKLHTDALDDIDWNKLTERQAAALGLSLGVFNDAVEALVRAREVMLSRVSSLTVVAIVGTALATWSGPWSTLCGILGTLVLGAAASWWHARVVAHSVERAQRELEATVVGLRKG